MYNSIHYYIHEKYKKKYIKIGYKEIEQFLKQQYRFIKNFVEKYEKLTDRQEVAPKFRMFSINSTVFIINCKINKTYYYVLIISCA